MLLFMLVLLHAIAVLTLVFCFLLSPQAIFKDPFRGGNNILVRPVILESCFILWYVD
jgi:hypothetical protein